MPVIYCWGLVWPQDIHFVILPVVKLHTVLPEQQFPTPHFRHFSVQGFALNSVNQLVARSLYAVLFVSLACLLHSWESKGLVMEASEFSE